MQNYNQNMEPDYADLYSQYTKMHTNSVDMDANNGVLHYQTNDMKPLGIQSDLQTNSTGQTYDQLHMKNDSVMQSHNTSHISQDLSLCYDNDVSNELTQNNTTAAEDSSRTKQNSMDVERIPDNTAPSQSTDAPIEAKSETNAANDIPAESPKASAVQENTEKVTISLSQDVEKTKPADTEPCEKEKASSPTNEESSKDVCRICMDTGVLISIFEGGETLRMCEKVMSCAAVQVAENDGLPGFICKLCASDLNIAYKFKTRCESSDTAFREKLGLKTKTIVKTEFVLIECENEPVVSVDGGDFSDAESDDPSYGSKMKKKLKKKKNKKLHKSKERSTRSTTKRKAEPEFDSDDDVILVTKKPSPSPVVTAPTTTRKGRKEATPGKKDTPVGKYPCSYCDKSFPYPSVLKLHLITHTKEKTHKCSICSLAFMYSKDLYAHYKDAHPNEYGKVDDSGKYTCNFCDKSFGQLKNLKVHEAVHSRDKKYKCEECSQGFTNMTALNLHKKQDHPGINKPFRCKICDKRFKQETTLEKHMENHKQKKPETKVVEEKKPTSTKDLFKSIAPVTTTYWSDSFSD